MTAKFGPKKLETSLYRMFYNNFGILNRLGETNERDGQTAGHAIFRNGAL